jgi:S1/P1 Nuclease
MVRLLALALVVAPIPHVLAWGALGHYAVAYVATNFVATSTKTYMQSLLADTTVNYLANVATWADSYRSTTAGAFSAPFHYIDAEDSPPSSCSVSYSRDCGSGGCIVSAISNYTTRIQNTALSTSERQMAAKFLVHFLGDIGQPLHCENLDVGGNTIDVTYSGSSTNLHSVWDSSIPQKIAGGSTQTVAKTWAANLTSGKHYLS